MVQLRRYEAGTSQPALDVIRKLRSLLEGMILKHEARRWQNVSTNGGESK